MNNSELTTSQFADLEAVIHAYLKAFEARDLAGCVAFFHDDSVIDFQSGIYRGTKGITDWHKDRFSADLRVNRVESVTVNDNEVIVDATISSKRLAAWKLQSIGARITVQFRDGRIQHGKLAPRMMNPINLIRSGQ
jgi:hypothetical protein